MFSFFSWNSCSDFRIIGCIKMIFPISISVEWNSSCLFIAKYFAFVSLKFPSFASLEAQLSRVYGIKAISDVWMIIPVERNYDKKEKKGEKIWFEFFFVHNTLIIFKSLVQKKNKEQKTKSNYKFKRTSQKRKVRDKVYSSLLPDIKPYLANIKIN